MILGYRLYAPEETAAPLLVAPASSPTSEGSQPAGVEISTTNSLAPVASTHGDSSGATVQSTGASEQSTAPGGQRTVSIATPEVQPILAPSRLVVLVSKMNLPAHTVTVSAHAAPELTAAAGEGPIAAAPLNGGTPGKADGLLAGAHLDPPPPTAPEAGESGQPSEALTPARLVSSTQPVYPLLAKQAHIEGDVVIEAQLDASGNVTGAKVISGPQMLREAALSALTKWKFQPALLRNQPTPSTTNVTLRFRLR